MRSVVCALIGFLALPGVAAAQAVKSTVTASNGVEVTVYSDDFADRKEYTSPYVKQADGQLMAATVRTKGITRPIELTGFFIYSGEWRRYASALFKGGDAAEFKSTGRDVGRCSSSRYSRPSCTLTESFNIALTPADIIKHGEGGTVAIQIRAEDTSTAIFEVPVSYLKAIAEIAQINLDPPKPAATPAPVPPTRADATPTANPVVRRSSGVKRRTR